MPVPLADAPPIEIFNLTLHLPEPLTIFLREWVWWTFINGFSVSLVLPGVLVFLGLVLFLRYGSALGLPTLFWRQDPWAQFLVGVGVGAVVWQVILAGYLFEEFATNFTVDRPPFCEVRPPYASAPDKDYAGFPGRFRCEPASVWSIQWYAGVIAASGAVMALAVTLVVLLIQYVGTFVRSRISGWRPYQHPKHEPPVGFGVWLPLGAVGGWVAMTAVTAVGLALGGSITGRIGENMLHWAGWGNGAARRAQVEAAVKFRKGEATKLPAEAGRVAGAEARDWYRPYAPVYGTFVLNFLLILVVSLAFIA
ncbi:MAG TPA: hypothetical protein VKE74_09205, partial [Gemmataceae bacterium]|nr:hypothetical protein [Gemmataceae bacterium]